VTDVNSLFLDGDSHGRMLVQPVLVSAALTTLAEISSRCERLRPALAPIWIQRLGLYGFSIGTPTTSSALIIPIATLGPRPSPVSGST